MVQRLGSYLLVERLNQGGMADVYLAKMFGFQGADQIVAVKCIRPEIAEDPTFARMFVDEAKLAVLLKHANIAQTYELGKIGSLYFMAMELIQGRDLKAVIERTKSRGSDIKEQLALYIMAQVCEGLDYAHRKTNPAGKPLNTVHLDVSPQNILVSYTGEVKVIDFGIAKAATHASLSQGQRGVLKGKFGYMSPEQVRSQPVDHRSDIFSAGIVLWELLTRERLYEGGSDASLLERVRNVEIVPPSLMAGTVSADIEAVIMRALERDPADRFSSASDMRDAIIGVMLQRYGTTSPRDLVVLMQELFADEQKEDLKALERARQVTHMPEDAESLADDEPGDQAPAVTLAKPVNLAPQASSPTIPDTRAATPPPSRAPAPTPMGPAPTRDLAPPGKSLRQAPRRQATPPRNPRTQEVTPGPPSPRPTLKVQPGDARPTEVRSAYRPVARRRDFYIIAGAILTALLLVLGTYVATRPASRESRGYVVITSVPSGAQVLLDGVLVGTTPYSSRAVVPGNHEVLVERPGYTGVRQSVRVAANQVLEVQVVLVPSR